MKVRYVFYSLMFLHLLTPMKPFLNEYLYDVLGILASIMTIAWFFVVGCVFAKKAHEKINSLGSD